MQNGTSPVITPVSRDVFPKERGGDMRGGAGTVIMRIGEAVTSHKPIP